MIPDTTKAFIFDLDGTLIDTEKYYHICWPEAVKHFGNNMSGDMHLAIRSLGSPYVQECFKKWFGNDFDYEAAKNYRKTIFNKMVLEKGVTAKDGAEELLKTLKEKSFITAIATATDLTRTNEYLELCGLKPWFDVICSAADMKHGKPAPEIYTFACEQIGVHPADCIAVEDSPNGVLSAYIAGLRVIYVPDLIDDEEKISNYIFAKASSLREIIHLIN